jgi:hypothetical protein
MSKLKRGVFSRYSIAKLGAAAEEVLHQLFSDGLISSRSDVFSRTFGQFKEMYEKQCTSVIAIAGAAMAPTLNARAMQDKCALEKLVLRNIPRPSSSTVLVGDIIAFKSPLLSPGAAEAQAIMVRRVAAIEYQEMISEDMNDQSLVLPKGHCWVLADNPNLNLQMS